jgi:hypothetical protein
VRNYLIAITIAAGLLAAQGAQAYTYGPETTKHMHDIQKLTEPNANGASLGACLAAITIAENNGGDWNARFTKEECAEIAAKAMDAGLGMPEDPDQ